MPIDPGTATVISTGANLLGSAVAGIGKRKQQKRAQRHNKELMELQHQKNLESWNLQNAYNTPEAQMKRYQEAGLNKHMVASAGNSGNAQGVSPYQAIQTEESSVLEGVGESISALGQTIPQYQDIQAKNTANDIAKEQAEKLRMENLNKAFDLFDRKYKRGFTDEKGNYTDMPYRNVDGVRSYITQFEKQELSKELDNKLKQQSYTHREELHGPKKTQEQIKAFMLKEYGNVPDAGSTSYKIYQYLKKNGTKAIYENFKGIPKGLIQGAIKLFTKGK